ncbi:hypothetical protein BDW60DRAFT_192094 [Aspergillus nidulans var. acristatus]
MIVSWFASMIPVVWNVHLLYTSVYFSTSESAVQLDVHSRSFNECECPPNLSDSYNDFDCSSDHMVILLRGQRA